MKRMFLILLFIPTLACAQSIGVKGGISVSNFYNNPLEMDALTAPNLGIIYTHELGMFQIAAEPSFNVKGSSFKVVLTDLSGNPIAEERIRHKYSYFEIPLTLSFVPLKDKFIFGIHAGLAPAFLLSSKVKNSFGETKIGDSQSFNLDFITGLKGGIMLTDNLFAALHLRYGTSLMDVSKKYSSRYYYFSPFMEIGYKF